MKLYDSEQHRHHGSLYGGHDPGVCCGTHAVRLLWLRGYPDQALKRSRDTVKLAQELSHPFTMVIALADSAWIHQHRGERQAAQQQANAVATLPTEQGFPRYVTWGKILYGRMLVEEGRGQEGIELMRQRWTGLGSDRMYRSALLAESYREEGQIQEGLNKVAGTIATMEKSSRRTYESELFRIKGELMLSDVLTAPKEAETCFRHAVGTAR